jgi:hypothetical protein
MIAVILRPPALAYCVLLMNGRIELREHDLR